MKRIVFSMLALLLMVSMVACSNNFEISNSEDTEELEKTSGENIIESLSEQELAQLNRYLSYFSEQRFEKYPTSDEQLYNFAYIYNKIYTSNLYFDSGTVYDYAYCVDKHIIDSTIAKFFNDDIAEISSDFVSLKDGIYYNIAADGATYPYLSIVRELYKESNNTYKIIFDIFEAYNLNGEPVPAYYYAFHINEAYINSSLSRQIGGSATVKAGENGEFIIVDYIETNTITHDLDILFNARLIPAGCSYYIKSSNKYLHEGDAFPDPRIGDIYTDGYYEYHFNESIIPNQDSDTMFADGWINWEYHRKLNGWSVRVIDDSLEEYPDIPTAIAGKPIFILDYTFALCSNLKKSPQIPATVSSMAYTFYGCEQMQKAEIIIPTHLTNMEATFMWCSSLTGNIVINATPTEFDNCFWRTVELIVIYGGCKNAIELVNTAGRGVAGGGDNVTIAPSIGTILYKVPNS